MGFLRVVSNEQLDQMEAEQRAAETRQQQPLILGLASHLRTLWDAAYEAKKPIERKMLKALRQRVGEYEPDVLAEIQAMGGSEVYMMVTETKCRGAESWLRDILMEGDDVPPFTLNPTPIPELAPDKDAEIHDRFAQKVAMTIEQGGMAPDPEMIKALRDQAVEDVRGEVEEEAQESCDAMTRRIRDQFVEGGMRTALDDFISDLVTYPAAFIKGPVVKRQRVLKWVPSPDGSFAAEVSVELKPTYVRVDPFRMYPEPGITSVHEGYNFEHHTLTSSDLSDLIGTPGYDDGAIRAVLDTMGTGGVRNWMWSADAIRAPLENRDTLWNRPISTVDALEFTGRISGKLLLEWGMTPDEVPDSAKEYDCNVWMIDRWVIKATLNYDPLGKKPYHKTSFIKRPGAYWMSAIPEVIEDLQQMCNAAARALNNNMGLASGPQVEINIDRLPPDEEITTLRPWRIWQTTNDPLGSGQPAIRFNQPDDRSQALMQVYTHFCKLADDQSGIPAYVYGDMQVGGAGRTASGLSMLMGSAGKGIRQVIMHIDGNVTYPMVTAQFNWNMRYLEDASIKGDAIVVPRGAITLANREQLNVRRVEFLQATANPIDAEIVGKPGRAAILREVAKGLSMPVDEIVPSKDKLELKEKLEQQLAAMQQAQPQQEISFNRDESGAVTGAAVFPGGAKKGGGDGNIVSNRQTGRGG
jgi:hypothetical protein